MATRALRRRPVAGARAPVLRWRCEWKFQRRVAVFGERSFGYHVWQPQLDGKAAQRELMLHPKAVS